MYAKCLISLPEPHSLSAITYLAVYILHVEYVVMKVTNIKLVCGTLKNMYAKYLKMAREVRTIARYTN